jgi:hypothetical protein
VPLIADVVPLSFTGTSDKVRKKLLEEHKQDDLKGALDQIDEKFQERRHAADPSLFTAQLQARGRAKVRLRAGDRVFYWDPKGVVGRLESQRECTVLEIFSDKTMANLALMVRFRVSQYHLSVHGWLTRVHWPAWLTHAHSRRCVWIPGSCFAGMTKSCTRDLRFDASRSFAFASSALQAAATTG